MALAPKLSKLIYTKVSKPLLFKMDPESVHDRFTKLGNRMGRHLPSRALTHLLFHYEDPSLEQNIAGIRFKNPVGLSAGFDKDAKMHRILPHIGFGFEQIGSLTFKAYEGNPKPRLHRLIQSKGIVVYYGLKNDGVMCIMPRLKKRHPHFPLSISVAKSNCEETSSTKGGIADYINCLKELQKMEDRFEFYTINISCPNTFGGEPFTQAEKLEQLLKPIQSLSLGKPIFLKMPLNTEWSNFKALLDLALKYKVRGVVISNLQKDRNDPSVKDKIPKHVKGSISGKPVWETSNQLISKTYQYCGDKLLIIGVGGIFTAEDAYEKIKRGASLVQLITGMIFEGPQSIGEINRGLVNLLKQDGYTNISEAIGSAHK
jgi:dihydroorotate dehydrogenase